MRANRLIICILAGAALAGCASRPINESITQVDPKAGYRPYLLIPKRQNNDPHTLFVLSFSGGGTRAAAFSYGVLEELHRTEIVVDGQRRRLIGEVDMIMGVSGGSFTALAYALYGERLFSEYETRFLKRDVEGTLLARSLNPFNWSKFIGGSAGRSETTRLLLKVGLAQGSDVAAVQRTMLEAVRRNPDVLAEPAPSVYFVGLGAASLDFEVGAFVGSFDKRLRVQHELNLGLEEALRASGIGLLSGPTAPAGAAPV